MTKEELIRTFYEIQNEYDNAKDDVALNFTIRDKSCTLSTVMGKPDDIFEILTDNAIGIYEKLVAPDGISIDEFALDVAIVIRNKYNAITLSTENLS